jgi:hypothetical protein
MDKEFKCLKWLIEDSKTPRMTIIREYLEYNGKKGVN